MSIRIKMVLLSLVILIGGGTLLTVGIFNTYIEFWNNIATATTGEHTVQDVASTAIDMIVDFRYVSKNDKTLIEDQAFLLETENKANNIDLYMYVEKDGTLIYLSQQEDAINFMSFYQQLEFDDKHGINDGDGFRIDVVPFETDSESYLIFRVRLEKNLSNGYIYYISEQSNIRVANDMIFGHFFRDLFIGLLICLLIISFVINRMVIKPLKELKIATERVGQGELEFSIESNRKDEIGKVINAFDLMKKELKTSIDQKMQYEENRKELLASISHDLKTPITSIKGYVEGIRDGVANDKEKMEQYLSVIYQKSVDLDQMIDDLFLYSKLDLHRLPFDFVVINVNDFFDDCYYELKMDLEKDGFELIYEKDIDDSTFIQLDPQQFKRAITNIVSNAVKYSGDQRQVVMKLQSDNDKIQFMIQDYGTGIEEEQLIHIFDKFYRCDPARNMEIKGSGLGLAITKQIVESHGGKIWAESEKGKGTKMFIELERVESNDYE